VLEFFNNFLFYSLKYTSKITNETNALSISSLFQMMENCPLMNSKLTLLMEF